MMTRVYYKKNRQGGFTLMEMVIVIVLAGILTGVLAPMMAVTNSLVSYFMDRENLREEGEVALARMTRDLRRVQDNLSIITADAQEFRFEDIDDVDLQYAYSSGTLTRREGSGGTPRTLIENITSFAFTYMDDDSVVIPTPYVGLGNMTELRKIRVEFTLQKNNETVHLTTDISPKNFRHETDLFP